MVVTAPGPIVEQILAQLFIAFGQGAGTMTVSHEAIAAARNLYINRIPEFENKWDEIALQSLEYARAIGRVAALRAVQHGRNVISKDDWIEAAKQVAQHPDKTYRFCPICMGAGGSIPEILGV
ncbi:MAG: hypothetical protein AUH72_18460 [Acidobacteria bacterium 13_1_40CM_4_65_8]|nr:MAG: hypothetical protein AUH72_18460 [Acidobacteria bacterium 13_1_40CM_4_65_8]OLE82912.1 MAG: hypothetical protein AUF76_07790 [Acidobacteria bacterium 13_1_20CM_2_65_9]